MQFNPYFELIEDPPIAAPVSAIHLEPSLGPTGETYSCAQAAYAHFNAAVGTLTKGAYEGPMRHLGGGPERVAAAIERAITARRAPTRVTVTASAKMMLGTRKLLSDRAWDSAMRRQFPQPG